MHNAVMPVTVQSCFPGAIRKHQPTQKLALLSGFFHGVARVMKKFQFTLKGFMPLLMHADNIEGSDELQAWRKQPANKGVSVAGDDRSPPWTWQTYCYHDEENIVMPSENVMVALRLAGAQMILKKMKTFKEITQSGLLISTEACEFRCDDKPVAWADIMAIRELTFAEQSAACKKLGFELFVKRARIGTSKHVRVRPKFSKWSVSGEIMVLKPEITGEILQQLFELAGKAGLCDWRPSGKTPGPYGQADAVVTEIK